MKTIKARSLIGKGLVKGIALVSTEPICFLGGIDVKTGIVTEQGHQLFGQCIQDKMLVFPTGKGSTGGSYLIYETVTNGKGPLCMLNLKVEQVTAIGCIMSDVPMMDEPDCDICTVLKTGDVIEANFEDGTITVL